MKRGTRVFRTIRRPHIEPDPTVSPTIYDTETPQENVIFWGTPHADTVNFLGRVRTGLWFYPDIVWRLINAFRPLSYIVLFAAIFFGASQAYTYAKNNPASALSDIPAQTLIEGAVGSVSSLNPLYVTHNQAERDLQFLIFNRLIRIGSDGNPQPELADTWAISEDGTQYTFFLRDDVMWHDGEKFTADDVIFTFETVQSLTEEESYQREFEDITFTKVDEYTIILELPETNPTLIDALAFPIVPKHILDSIRPSNIKFSKFNTYPVGTGPFMIDSWSNDSITLTANKKYYLGSPKLDSIVYLFYADENEASDALRTFEIHTFTNPTGKTLSQLSDYQAYTTYSFTSDLRQKVIYFNLRNSGPLSYGSVRRALSEATNREAIVSELSEGGTPCNSPIAESSWAFDSSIDTFSFDVARASKTLSDAGWNYDEGSDASIYRMSNGEPLTITLSYLESRNNNIITQVLKEQWAAVGVKLELDPQSYERISSETVPRRNFDALLFEIEITPDPDKYNFWHSSAVDYPGLNLSGYSYERVDILLERARTETDKDLRAEDYSLFQMYILNEMPALYLYHPDYNFIAHDSVRGIELGDTLLPHHRYLNIQDWWIER